MKQTVESRAYARAGLLGNPSDGYGGSTISFAFEQYCATVTTAESKTILIKAGPSDRLEFSSTEELSEHIDSTGYYGGVRLIKSVIKRLHDYCRQFSIPFNRAFEIGYDCNIPRQVGLAGSSAIVIATLRCLCQWNDFEIEPAILAGLALEAEADLGIAAGPQDRVIQAFEGAMYMDFSAPTLVNGVSCGQYSRLLIPREHKFYIAFSTAASEPTEVLHGDLKSKMRANDFKTVAAINTIAQLPAQGKIAIETNDHEKLAELIDRNFDLRKSICSLNPQHVKMIEAARHVGASAKYCGSGGAIVGTVEDENMFELLKHHLGSIGCTVFRPQIVGTRVQA